MKKSLRKTTAIALAVMSTAGIAGATTIATTNNNYSNNGTEVVVKADTQVRSSEIMKVMNAAQDAEYKKLIVAGEPLSKKEQKELEEENRG